MTKKDPNNVHIKITTDTKDLKTEFLKKSDK